MAFVTTGMSRALLNRVCCALTLVICFSCSALAQQRQRHPAHARAIVPNRYIVVLADAPVASRASNKEELHSAAAQSYRAQVKANQAALTREIESRGMHVTGSASDLVNTLFVTADSSRFAELQSLPGVVAVRPMRRFQAKLDRALTAMNAPAAWTVLGGQTNAGAGIKIGILDTGIDQTHPAFQDSSLTPPAGFPKCTAGHPEDCAYTNNKVIVARSYVRQLAVAYASDPKNPAAQSQPDDYSPRDRVGHGTATASCAAGAANTGAGISTSGSAISFTGMAPKAFLGNYKIAGSPGVNDGPADDIMIQALEDAISDGMDVISVSFGGPAMSDAASDPVAAAFEAAAQKAVVVVAAGNSGEGTYDLGETYPYFNSISSPAIAPTVIGVGAAINSHAFNPSVSVVSGNAPSSLKNITAQLGDSAFFTTGTTTAPLVDVTTLGDNGLACSPLPAASLTGAIALIEHGTCSFDTKAINAQTAGAVGIIFYMADSSALVTPIDISSDFIGPTVMIANSDGVNLKQFIEANPGQSVTIDYAGLEQDIAAYSAANGISPALAVNQFASYSSVGPTPDGRIKPDLIATGGDDPYAAFTSGMYMAVQNYDPNGELFSANRYGAADGTSFSTPITAGAAALVKQAHPNYTPLQIRSALINSAAQDVTQDDFGDNVDVEWIGAGRLDAGAAAAATVTAQPATASFGYAASGGSLPSAITVTLTNNGSSSVTLSAAVAPNATATGATFGVSPSSITLAAGASGAISISVTGAVPAPGEYSGFVNLTGSGATVRIPYMMLVGDGQLGTANVIPVSSSVYGYPGQDGGPLIVQVVDQYGVPIVGTPVSFTLRSRGAVTLRSYGQGEPACTPDSSTTAVTCNTDKFGFAYADVLLGSTLGSPLINIKAAACPSCQTLQGNASIMAQPTITAAGVVNDATFQGTIAPGSYIAIFGSNLLDTANLSNYAFYNNLNYDIAGPGTISSDGSLPLQLDYTSVSFDVPSAGISVPGYLYFVSPTQVNVYVPWELAGQSSVQMKVSVDEGLWGNVVTVPLSSTAPGFFLNNGNVADALDANYKVISAANPAVRGQVIQLYCNGLGPVTNQPASGAPASANPLSLTTTLPVVMIGGQQAKVQFSGLAPGIVGEYQVNVVVPDDIQPGNQPITISIGGQTSPSQTAGSSPQTIIIPVK
jgi:uncharacterized protein (TIGR03437 family)